ncbi:hypothetical protein BH11BAC7_BH11BAC7_01800 [soil metagenome]
MKPTLKHYIIRLLMQGRVGRNIRTMLVIALLILTGMNSNANLSAQSFIGFDLIGLIGMPDTVADGDGYLVGALVKNFSQTDSLSNDVVQIVGYIDTLSGPTTPFSLPPVSGISLSPGNDTFFILPFVFDAGTPAGFHIGNNVIVVWPITTNPNFGISDSVTVNVVILDGISTGPEQAGGEVRCFPVPVNGPLYVTSSSRMLVIKSILIRDAAGKIVTVSDNPSQGINTDAWAAGIYILEVTFDNGKETVYKIIR